MTQRSQTENTGKEKSWSEEMEETSEYFENSGEQNVPMKDLLAQVHELDKLKIPDEKVLEKPKAESFFKSSEDELANLMAGVQSSGSTSKAESKKKTESNGLLLEDSTPRADKFDISDEKDLDEGLYEESFASQQETAQLREDFDRIASKFESLEKQLTLVMKERDNLPTILNGMRADLNSQLTLLSDKMYSAMESNVNPAQVESALATIETVRHEHSDQIKSAAGYLSTGPKASSPLVLPGATLKGKGKFKPVK